MNTFLRRALFVGAALSALSLAPHAQAQTTLTYFNFNTVTSSATLLASSGGTQSSTITTNFAAADVTNFGGTTINAQGTDTAGQAVAFLNQTENGNYFQFSIPTTGYQNIALSFATQRTGTGFNSDLFSYSTNGTTFTSVGSAYTPAAAFALQSFSLPAGANDAANVTFRFTLSGASSASGNNRIDNLLVTGNTLAPVPEPSGLVALALGAGVLGLMAARRRTAGQSANG